MLPAKPLTLEMYHCFFLDPWNTRIARGQLNQILYMHSFAKLHQDKKAKIMEHLVGQVDLMPPRRSTLHSAALSVASSRASAAVITAAQARDDVEAIGWAECPIGSVAAFTVAAPSANNAPEEPVERVPLRADFVLAGRRPRSRRTRASAYGPKNVAAASTKLKAGAGALRNQAKVVVKEEKMEPELVSPPPPPPVWTRSPTPPLPASPPPPQDVAPPPPPPPPSQSQLQPTLSPIPAPPGRGTPMVLPHPSQQQFWGLPLPTRPAAQPCPATPPAGWSVPTPPPFFPAPFWGAPVMLPPLAPHVAWRWPPAMAQHPPMQLQRSPPPPLLLRQPPPHFQRQPLPSLIQTPPRPLLLQQPPPHLQGQPLPALLRTPPPPTLQHFPPPHFGAQHPPPALHQALPPPMMPLQPPLSTTRLTHLQGQ